MRRSKDVTIFFSASSFVNRIGGLVSWGGLKQCCVFKSRTQFRFAFLHQTLGFPFFTVHRIKSLRLSRLSLHGKYRPFPAVMRCDKVALIYREGGWPFAHGAALHSLARRQRRRCVRGACLPGGEKAMQKVACVKLCSMESHTFFRLGAVLITVLVGVSKAVFLLVGRYKKKEKRCAFRARCLVMWGYLISGSSRSNWPQGKMAKRVNTQSIGWSGCNVLER